MVSRFGSNSLNQKNKIGKVSLSSSYQQKIKDAENVYTSCILDGSVVIILMQHRKKKHLLGYFGHWTHIPENLFMTCPDP